jgi:hypothetical protein
MSTANSTVTYKTIPGFSRYRAGDDGSVWSLCLPKRRPQLRRLRPHTDDFGYLVVALAGDNGKVSVRRIHRIVLETFAGPPPAPKMDCCHNDGNPANNVLSNLRWATRAENMADAMRHGTFVRGEQRPQAKLNAEAVRVIRAAVADGSASMGRLAKRFGVSVSAVSQVVRGLSWGHIE